MFKTPKF